METEMPDQPTDEEREGFEEPWLGGTVIVDRNQVPVAEMIPDGMGTPGAAGGGGSDLLNASRILTCVNTCRGLPDPEAAIAGLVRAADDLLRELDDRGAGAILEEIKLDAALAPFLAARKERNE